MTVFGFDPTLLPATGDSERCAAHAERIDLDPGGSALWLDELFVVDVPLPWPKPVWAKDGFTAVPEMVMAAGEAGRRVRVLAAVPLGDGISRVVTHRLVGDATFARMEHHVGSVAEVIDLVTLLLTEGLDAHPTSVVAGAAIRELLLCTQGSHDMCCGSRGASLHAELAIECPEVAVRRVSHTGGHRMAPTGVTLPDGRMWGMVDAAEIAGILDHSVPPSSVARRCRGWIGAEMGPAQMAERAVFAAADSWEFDSRARTTRVLAGGPNAHEGGRVTVEVVAGGAVWHVDVEPGRAVPTIACGAPGGLPAKPGAEWRVGSVSRQSG